MGSANERRRESATSSFIGWADTQIDPWVNYDVWTQWRPGHTLYIAQQWYSATASLTQAMMTSSNGNISRVTGHLCGEFTGPRWIPHTKTSDAELWCFLWSWGWWLETLSCSLWRQSNEANVVTTVLADAHASSIIIRQNWLRCVTEIIDDTRILLLGMIWCQQATRNNVDSIWRHWVTTGNRQALWHT